MKKSYRVQVLYPDGSLYCELVLEEQMVRSLKAIAIIEEISFEEVVGLAFSMGARTCLSTVANAKKEITAGMLNQNVKGGQG